jgi:proteasome alpha subunit
MSMPFYVSPEQVMEDKANFARKGISRGKSIVVLEIDAGVLLMAENATSLSKVGEIYDRIAFAGVGKFSEFDQLRKLGVRFADSKGYAYSREDVRGKALASAYSQAIGEVFTREMKPLEIELVVAEVGDDRYEDHKANSLFKINFDGFISDHKDFCAIGGNVDSVEQILKADFRSGMTLKEAVALGRKALDAAAERGTALTPENMEVCVLNRAGGRRKFQRLSTDEIREIVED